MPEVILLTTDTVPEDFPDTPELDHGFDGRKSLPGFGSTPFLIFIPRVWEARTSQRLWCGKPFLKQEAGVENEMK